MPISKKIIIIITLISLIIINITTATQYYVSNTGNDSADGTTMGTSWKTLDKVDNTSLAPGDIVSLKKGDTWRESLGLNRTAITYNSYGNGTKPRIYGSINGTNSSCWADNGGNIWTYTCNLTQRAYTIFYNTNTDTQYGQRRTTYAGLTNDYDYFSNSTNYTIVYSSIGNPGSTWNGIEIPTILGQTKGGIYGLLASNTSSIWIDGLDIRYTQADGSSADSCAINIWGSSDVNVTNTDIKYTYHKGLCYWGFNNGQTSKGLIENVTLERVGVVGSSKAAGAAGENIWIAEANQIITNNVTISKYSNVGINYYHNNAGIVKNTRVQNAENVVAGNGGSGIYFDGCNNTQAFNNFLIDCGNIGISVNSERAGSNTTSHNITNNTISRCYSALWITINTDTNPNIKVNMINISHNTFYTNTQRNSQDRLVTLRNFSMMTFRDNIIETTATNTSFYLLVLADYNRLNSYNNSYNRTTTKDFSVDAVDKTWAQWQALGYDTTGFRYSANFTSYDTLVPNLGGSICTASSEGTTLGSQACGNRIINNIIALRLGIGTIKIYGRLRL